MMKLIWHYTNGHVINEILESGVIKLASAGLKPPERAACHFSTNPHWDPSANRGNLTLKRKGDYQMGVEFDVDLQKDIEETEFDPDWMDKHMGRFRIGVIPEAAPHGWRTYVKLASVQKEIVEVMEKADPARLGSPNEWRHSLQPVPRKMWRTVEKMEHGIWIKHVDILGGVRGSSPEGGTWGRS
jgi:hypothetical protein